MKRVLSTLPLVGSLAAGGCQEDPSFFLSWKLAGLEDSRDPDDLPDLKNALQCSEHGLGVLRLSTFVGDTNVLADQRTFPCFPPEFPDDPQPGPELEPGDYTLVLEGVRDAGGIWEREFCSWLDIPPEWDPTPTCDAVEGQAAADTLGDGPMDCVCVDEVRSCFEVQNGCSPGTRGCRCLTREEVAGKDGDFGTEDDLPGPCGSAIFCTDDDGEVIEDDSEQWATGTCLPPDAEPPDVCGAIISTCPLEPSRIQRIRTYRCQFAEDVTTLTIPEEQTSKPTLDEFVLLEPPECDDGVDNDRDGLTDLSDQACLLSPLLGKEEDEKALSLINIDVTYFDDNPNINCPGLGIGRLSLRIDLGDGFEELSEVSCSAPVTRFEPVTLALEPGQYPIEVIGIKAGTEDEPATIPKVPQDEEGMDLVLDVQADQGAFLKSTIDIGPDDLLAPINGEIRVKFSFEQADGLIWTRCQDPPGGGLLDGTEQDDGLTRIALTVYEETGIGDERSWAPIDPNTIFDVPSLQDAMVNGDALDLPCALAGNKELRSLDVDWKRYAVRATASEAGGLACFDAMLDMSTDPFRLAPGADANLVVLPRVLEDGAPVDACIDCNDTTDCENSHTCVDNICEAP